MTSYRQDITFIEDDYGKTTVTFMISDEHGGLFTDSATETNIFDLSDIVEKQQEDGQLAESELNLTINEGFARNLNEHAAASFIAAAINPATKRYCAVFFDTDATPAAADMRFQGVILPEYEKEFIGWDAADWAATIDILSEIKFTAQPFQENVFDSVSLETLIEGDGDGGDLPDGIEEAWETTNVADRAGYYDSGSGLSMKCHRLVSLDVLLRKLADNMESILATKGFGTYTIDFDRSEIGGFWQPARWNKKSDGYYINTSSASSQSFVTPSASDYNTLAIDPDSASPDNYEQIWINYSVIKLADEDDELNPSSAKSFLWYEKCETFTDLLYGIAENFDMFPKIYHSDSSTIKIKFISRSTFNSSRIYFRAPEKGNVKYSGTELENSRYYGRSFYKASEGFDAYVKDDLNTFYMPGVGKSDERKNKDSIELLMTISPTIAFMPSGGMFPNVLPHNHFLYSAIDIPTLASVATKAVHTGIYLYVDALDGETNAPANYWTPCRAFYQNLDGSELGYSSLSAALNKINKRDKKYFDAELSLDVPGWRWFSPNADGSSPCFPELGNYISINSVDYSIVEVKTELAEPRVSLKLHASDRFDAIVDPTTPDLIEEAPIVGSDPEVADAMRTANGEFAAGNLMSIRSDGDVEASVPTDDHYDRVYGFALNSGVDGDLCYLRLPGGDPVNVDTLGFDSADVGKRIWLRRVPESANNVSTSPLTAAIADPEENFYFSPGVITDVNQIDIDFGIKAILK